MKTISEVAGQVLTWKRLDSETLQFELRAGEGDVVATLRWLKASGSLAVGESAQGCWTLKRTGFLHPKVTVRVNGAGQDLATFSPNWGGDGLLRFVDGRSLSFAYSGFWLHHWAFLNKQGEQLIAFHPEVLHLAARVEVTELGAGHPDLALLALLGWYLIMLIGEDAADASRAVLAENDDSQ